MCDLLDRLCLKHDYAALLHRVAELERQITEMVRTGPRGGAR